MYHVVVGWEKKGEEFLTNELVEAISSKKLIIKDRQSPQVGIDVSYQFKNELWKGKILSLHGKFSPS